MLGRQAVQSAMANGLTSTPSCSQNEATVKLRDWTVGMMHYDQVLSGLKEIPAKRPSVSDSSDDSKSSEDKVGELALILWILRHMLSPGYGASLLTVLLP